MIKTLLILGLLSGFGLMFLGVISLFSNYAELIMPSSGGQVMNADRTAQMQASALRPGAGAGGGATVVNAPVPSSSAIESERTSASYL